MVHFPYYVIEQGCGDVDLGNIPGFGFIEYSNTGYRDYLVHGFHEIFGTSSWQTIRERNYQKMVIIKTNSFDF